MSRTRKSTPRTPELAALGWAIERLMARRPGATQQQVAAVADMDNGQVSSYVCGQIAPNYLNLLRLCEGLNAKPVELMALIEEFKAREAAAALGVAS
jgi:transcriptional regulator with XRE-family HTH domain